MKAVLFLSLVLGSLSAFSQVEDSTVVAGLNRQWMASYSTRDTATMGRILAEDFQMISPKGGKLNRADVMRNIASPQHSINAFIDSASVRVFDNTAIVVAYTRFTMQSGDHDIKG